MDFSKINELKPYDLNCNIFDVYSYNALSMQELLCQFFTKINECIKTSNETIDLAEWLVNEGLKQEVALKLTNWLNDGTLENIINVNLFENLNNKIDNVTSQLEQTVNKFNNFIIDYKGLCVRSWIEGSLYTDRFRSDLIEFTNKTGVNSIALTVNTYQASKTSNNPFGRIPIKLNEIEDYIKFLKSNNLRILFKHHVECDTSDYVWRAEIDPTDIDEWFYAYKINIIEYAKICEKYKVEAFSIGSEYRTISKKYPNKFRELIKEVRKIYSGLITYGANLNNDERDEVHSIEFWDCLDFIGLDFYIHPVDNGTVEDYKKAFYHTKNHKNVHLMLDSISNKFNKPIIFCEYGLSGNDENKANYIQAINESLFTKDYIKGGFIWVYDPTKTDWVENDLSINIVKSNNIIKGTLKNDGYYTTIKNSDVSSFSKYLEYKVNRTYKDVYIDFDFYIKGSTSNKKQDYSKVRIKVATHDTLTPTVFYEVDGNISETSFIYKITDDIIEFFVKVPQYCTVIYKPNTSEIGQFNILEYQPLENISDGINAENKVIQQKSTGLTIAKLNGINVATGVVTGSMSSGVINKSITIPNLSQVFGISVNVNYINGGNSYDVVCHGNYMGNNTITFNGKHLTVQGGYTYELSYIVYYI